MQLLNVFRMGSSREATSGRYLNVQLASLAGWETLKSTSGIVYCTLPLLRMNAMLKVGMNLSKRCTLFWLEQRVSSETS